MFRISSLSAALHGDSHDGARFETNFPHLLSAREYECKLNKIHVNFSLALPSAENSHKIELSQLRIFRHITKPNFVMNFRGEIFPLAQRNI